MVETKTKDSLRARTTCRLFRTNRKLCKRHFFTSHYHAKRILIHNGMLALVCEAAVRYELEMQ